MSMKTDNELRRDVERELQWDPSVDARDIGVAAKNGVVTLTGQVANYFGKWQAEQIVKRVAGVAGLANDIEVRLSAERSDTDIAQAAAFALKINTAVPPDRVKVIVEHAWVTLEGKVDWYYQRSAAESAVRHLMGVKAVTNAIDIMPKAKPADVRHQIEQAFERNAQIDARRISIETNDRKVILRGTVRSWAELDEAETAAWAAPGVSEVDNRLTVSFAEQ
jgi:osmotically-inducible protein OsmY